MLGHECAERWLVSDAGCFLMGVSFRRGCGLTALADGYYVSAAWRRKLSRGKETRFGMVCHRAKEFVLFDVAHGPKRFSKGVQKNRGDPSIEQDRGRGDDRNQCRGPAGRPDRRTRRQICVVCNNGNAPISPSHVERAKLNTENELPQRGTQSSTCPSR